MTQINLFLPFLFVNMIAFTLNQQIAPQYWPIWGEAGDLKLFIE